MNTQPAMIEGPANQVDIPIPYRSPHKSRTRPSKQWWMSWSMAILAAVYAFHGENSWVGWTTVMGFIVTSMLIAMVGPAYTRLYRLPLAWAMLGAAFITVILFSDISIPVSILAVISMATLYRSLWNMGSTPIPAAKMTTALAPVSYAVRKSPSTASDIEVGIDPWTAASLQPYRPMVSLETTPF